MSLFGGDGRRGVTGEGATDWLPDLLVCDWSRLQESIERAYAVFRRDFCRPERRPMFRGKRMGLKRHPLIDGREATFWHFVTEGKVEKDRYPVCERIERIAWPRAMLVEAGRSPSRVLVWSNQRPRRRHGKATRWVVALEDFSYVVIVDERESYVLPWTAYPVRERHRRRKLREEYRAWVERNKG